MLIFVIISYAIAYKKKVDEPELLVCAQVAVAICDFVTDYQLVVQMFIDKSEYRYM